MTAISMLSSICATFLLLFSSVSLSAAVLTESAATSDLAAGLLVNQVIIQKVLPENIQSADSSQTQKEFYDLLHSLTLISEREKELQAILTMSGVQDDAELMAVQVVLQKLTENACALLKLKVGDQVDCAYADLKVLKATIEALHTVRDKSYPSLIGYYKVIQNIMQPNWLQDNVVCSLSASSLDALNSFSLYGGRSYSQDSC